MGMVFRHGTGFGGASISVTGGLDLDDESALCLCGEGEPTLLSLGEGGGVCAVGTPGDRG